MSQIYPIRIKFYEFLNGDINRESLENWVYENKEIENELPNDDYIDLISFDFKSRDTKAYVTSLVKKLFDWQEFEKWRIVVLLEKIVENKIEIVLATRKLRQLHIEQEESIKWPLISIKLGIGFESVLDNCPIESEYSIWNSEALQKQLKQVEWYKVEIKETAEKELRELLNNEFKSIDLGEIIDNKHLHDLFSEKLHFPDFYVYNWDAFWDSITGLVEMPKKLILHNWDKYEIAFSNDAKILKKIVEDYNKVIIDRKIEIKTGCSTKL